MKASDFTHEFKDTIKQLKERGVEQIHVDNLINYLDEAEKDLNSTESFDVECYRAKLQKWIEDHKIAHSHSIEMFRSVIQAGQNALHAAFLMNGGSSVAILAFIGHLASSSPEKVSLFADCLAIFVVGVLIAGLASGITYLSQWFYFRTKKIFRKTGFVLNIVAMLLGLSSYLTFGYGIRVAYKTFSNFI